MDELRAKVRADLEATRRSPRPQQEERDALIKALIERNPFEVPKAMVERAIDSMLEGALRQMQRSGLDVRNLGLDFMRLRDEMRERAVQEVKGTLLFEAIAQKERHPGDRRGHRQEDRGAGDRGRSAGGQHPQVLQEPG